jgi:hypothetical protein
VSCESSSFTNVNATGSVTFGGFPASNSSNINTWTISTAITQTRDFAANTSSTDQTFWLNTSPVIETKLNDLPYWGCLILLEGFQKPLVSTRTNYSTTCDGIFSTDCYSATVDLVSLAAFQQDYNQSIAGACQAIASTSPPRQCKGKALSSNITAG